MAKPAKVAFQGEPGANSHIASSELYPDARWIVTENAHSNGPMLNINRTMGFKAYRTAVEYQMTREQLEARL